MSLDELEKAWKVLTDREKTVITKRFGLNGEKPQTLKTTGKAVGLTREGTRQVQNKALTKLRLAGTQLQNFGKITFKTPVKKYTLLPLPPSPPALPKPQPKVKRKKKSKPISEPKFRYNDRQRLDWLEHAIRHMDMRLNASLWGGMTIYIDGKGGSSGCDLRGVLDVAMKRNPLP